MDAHYDPWSPHDSNTTAQHIPEPPGKTSPISLSWLLPPKEGSLVKTWCDSFTTSSGWQDAVAKIAKQDSQPHAIPLKHKL
jgi:hypothetical protein